MAKFMKMNVKNEKGYKKFKAVMKKMGFSDESLFLRYCVTYTYRSYATPTVKKLIDKELKLIRAYIKKK